jgi:hypothetical protein
MKDFQLYSLKDLMEDFYVSEISSSLALEIDCIDYKDSQEIIVDGKPFETLLSERQTSKKEVFRAAESRVLNYLQSFTCEKNQDVQDFLHDAAKSIRMQKKSVARTYMIIDSVNDEIAAYFAIAFKPIILEKDHELSKSKVKKLPIHTDEEGTIEIIPTILIGQIGRADGYSKDDIDLEDILDYIFGIINIVKAYIGGKVVLVEVNNEPKLVEHYKKYGFEKIQESSDMSQLMQFVNHY